MIINLPIINYFEHGTYLTVNHGHAALMGVYGNVSIAAVLFCSRHLIVSRRWNVRLLRSSFWAINVGLLLMVTMNTFPAGVLQFKSVVENGYWAARSQEFILGGTFQVLTWMRAVGGVVSFLWSDTSVLLHDDALELAQGCCARACIRGFGSCRRIIAGV